MAKSKIFKDAHGLYTICGGYITRPFYGTSFLEGENVNTHHFGGSTDGGVTSPNKKETHNFKKSGQYEIWCTTGVTSTEYKKKRVPSGDFYSMYTNFEDYLLGMTEWYKKHQTYFGKVVYEKRNQEFKK